MGAASNDVRGGGGGSMSAFRCACSGMLSRGAGRAVAVASALLIAVTTVTGVLPAGPAPAARADDITASQDTLRTN